MSSPFCDITLALTAYAQGNGQKYPEGKTANEAMRQLFIMGLVDDESLFVFNGLGLPEHHADGKIGTAADGYAEALAPGECDVTYNPGLNPGLTPDLENPTIPLLWYKIKAPSGVYRLINLAIGGTVYTQESATDKFIDFGFKDGREILSPENGVDPARVLLPEVK